MRYHQSTVILELPKILSQEEDKEYEVVTESATMDKEQPKSGRRGSQAQHAGELHLTPSDGQKSNRLSREFRANDISVHSQRRNLPRPQRPQL